MNTLVLVLAAIFGDTGDQPVWQQSYMHAEKMAAQEQKPVAVFLTQGQNGLSRLIQGGLNEQAKEILTRNYIPVMVDTSTPEGQRLARAFQIQSGQGVVLSNRGGTMQAFWLQGSLSNQDLVRDLQKYASVGDVTMTEVASPVDEQGSGGRRMSRRGSTGSTVSDEGQRRGLRGRMNRRTN